MTLKNSKQITKLLAIGDCNTLGAGELEAFSYPERLANLCNAQVINCGLTMSTSREGVAILKDNISDDIDCILIQFGLVDAYNTFRYAPYVPYYPDNIIRKQLRSIVKKYKKVSRQIGLCDKLGEVNVVPLAEYVSNYQSMLEIVADKTVILPETIPNPHGERNPEICRYNIALQKIADSRPNTIFVPLFDHFKTHLHEFYLDKTHSNAKGYDYLAGKIYEALSY